MFGIIDTGSSLTCLSSNFIHLCHNTNRIDTLNIRVFNGETYTSEGSADINLNFGEFNMNLKNVCIINGLRYDFIIGMPNIKSLQILNEKTEIKIILNNHRLNVQFTPDNCFAVSNLTIPAQTSNFVKIRMDGEIPPGPMFLEGIKSLPPKMKELTILDTFSTRENPIIHVVNTTDKEIFIPKNYVLAKRKSGSHAPVNALHIERDHAKETDRHEKFLSNRQTKFKPIKIPHVKFDKNMSKAEREHIQEIFNRDYQCFAYNKFDIGLVRGMRYRVDLKPDSKNWFQPQRRIAPAKCKEVREQFEKELEYGLISRGSSKYNHALVLVKKMMVD